MKKEDKEKIITALENKKRFLCPKCKHHVFARKGYARVEITEEEDSILDDMVNGFEEFTYRCAKCDEPLEIEDMETEIY